jgi:hypothetical protein
MAPPWDPKALQVICPLHRISHCMLTLCKCSLAHTLLTQGLQAGHDVLVKSDHCMQSLASGKHFAVCLCGLGVAYWMSVQLCCLLRAANHNVHIL